MSAIAMYCHEEEIFLFSDGFGVHFETDEILTKESKKIVPVNGNCAVLNMGSHFEIVRVIVEEIKQRDDPEYKYPEQVATYLGERLYDWFAVYEHILGIETREFLNLVVGYNEDGYPELYELFYDNEDKFSPEQKEFSPGTGIGMAVRLPADESGFQQQVNAYMVLGGNRRQATLKAFQNLVEMHPDYGIFVGGKIFTENLKPKGE